MAPGPASCVPRPGSRSRHFPPFLGHCPSLGVRPRHGSSHRRTFWHPPSRFALRRDKPWYPGTLSPWHPAPGTLSPGTLAPVKSTNMSLLDHTPQCLESDAVRFAREFFDLEVRATRLASERDQNFLLETTEQKYVLKIANAADPSSLIEAQNGMLRHLERAGVSVPRLVPARDGHELVWEPGGHLLRLVTWIPGVPLGDVPHHSPALLEDVGGRVGELNAALASFDYPALHRHFHWDLVRATSTAARWLPLV